MEQGYQLRFVVVEKGAEHHAICLITDSWEKLEEAVEQTHPGATILDRWQMPKGWSTSDGTCGSIGDALEAVLKLDIGDEPVFRNMLAQLFYIGWVQGRVWGKPPAP